MTAAAEELDRRRSELVEVFCLEDQQHVLDRLRAKREPHLDRQELARICGIHDEAFLDELAEHACPESLATLVFAPLLAVAWSDGGLSSRERGIILDAAEDFGITRGSPAFNLLGQWLAKRPTRKLREAWVAYVRALSCGLCAKDRRSLSEKLLGHARELSELIGDTPSFSFMRRRIKKQILRQLSSAFVVKDVSEEETANE